MNTKFEYQYRDAENYKKWNEIVITGQMSRNDVEPYLYERQFFIPSAVGLEDLQNISFHNYDHIWHEIISVTDTTESPTIKLETKQIIYNFRNASTNRWNLNNIKKGDYLKVCKKYQPQKQKKK